MRVLRAGDSFLSQASKRLVFGLGTPGTGAARGSLTVHWPGGAPETIENVSVNHSYRVVQGSGVAAAMTSPERKLALATGEAEKPDHTDVARIILSSR
ncbi:MAG: ASPIC/UnbV domain-containing protein, partial [Verrucomicrobiota bacterium]